MTRIILMVGTILFSLGLFAQTEITDQIVYTCQIKNELCRKSGIEISTMKIAHCFTTF